jgi:hypothetical protein
MPGQAQTKSPGRFRFGLQHEIWAFDCRKRGRSVARAVAAEQQWRVFGGTPD